MPGFLPPSVCPGDLAGEVSQQQASGASLHGFCRSCLGGDPAGHRGPQSRTGGAASPHGPWAPAHLQRTRGGICSLLTGQEWAWETVTLAREPGDGLSGAGGRREPARPAGGGVGVRPPRCPPSVCRPTARGRHRHAGAAPSVPAASAVANEDTGSGAQGGGPRGAFHGSSSALRI